MSKRSRMRNRKMPITMKAIRIGEGDADLHHQRHALRAGGGEVDAVLQRHEADHLADRVAPRHHHQQADQHDRQRQRDVLARHRIGVRGDRQHHLQRQRRPGAMPASMVRPMPTTVSISRWMPRRNTMRRSANGMRIALKPSAIAAVM